MPLLLPYLEDELAIGRVLDRADGVLLGFGRDVDPALYDSEPHPAMTELSPLRDAFEVRLVREALARGLPLLGICRGMQLLNVALGGTLYRDRSEFPPRARGHPGGDWSTWDLVCAATLGRGPMPEHPTHPLVVDPGSRLAAAIGSSTRVNSYHHQAVRNLGDGLRPVAWAPDGVIEAIALDDDERVMGVQWELQQAWLEDPRFLDVFGSLVDASRRASPAPAA